MSAIISDCGAYRYSLTREGLGGFLGDGPRVPLKLKFIMLNPSTADATIDDPTIRRCMSFAKGWEYNEFEVLNLYALRATNPLDLWVHGDPIGPDNDGHLRRVASDGYAVIVCAWGANAKPERAEAVRRLFLMSGKTLWCLGMTKGGAPRHPLYVRGDQQLTRWAG